MQNPSSMGASAQSVLAILPSIPNLHLESTATGLWLKRDQQPLAWIVVGYHQGKIAKQTSCCHFVDVAYYRETQYGINLETADFDSLEQALAFLTTTFQLGGAE